MLIRNDFNFCPMTTNNMNIDMCYIHLFWQCYSYCVRMCKAESLQICRKKLENMVLKMGWIRVHTAKNHWPLNWLAFDFRQRQRQTQTQTQKNIGNGFVILWLFRQSWRFLTNWETLTMKLGVKDWQSESDIDSIRIYCDVLSDCSTVPLFRDTLCFM